MKSSRLYRLGAFALLTSASIVTAVACSDDDKPAAQPAANDSGTPQADTGGPQQQQDAGSDATTPPPSPGLVVNLAHALSDLENIQICLGVGTAFPAADPIPPTGGIPAGAGNGLPVPDAFVPVLANLPLVPYVFPAGLMHDGAKCADIVGGDAGVPSDKVFQLSPIPPGTLKLGKSYLILLLGCQAGNEGGEAVCGTGYDGTSNLRTEVIELDPTDKGADKYGFQFVHASPQAQAFFQGAFGESKVLAQVAEDAGAPTNIGDPASFTKPVTATPATAVASMTALSDPAANGIQFLASDGGAFPAPVFVNFDTIALMTTGAADAGYFKSGNNYTFVAIGNPGSENPQTDPHGFRLIALRSSLQKK
jgi:hypothetical protein